MLFLVALILILTVVIVLQFHRERVRSKQLKTIYNKLNERILALSHEKLLLFTDDHELQKLVVEINQLLELQHQSEIQYTKKEMSIKKMLANISHDLKTPLTVVLGYIETLNYDQNMEPKERQLLLQKVHQKTLETLELMQRFFQLARLESGDVEFPLGRIHINEICRKNILHFYDLLTTRGLEVQIDIPDQPIYALANDEALERILNNLLANAITYGADGRVIGLCVRDDEHSVYIDVWDRGVGIAEWHKDRVFERLFTLDDSRKHSFANSGLGLTITKRLVEALGGSIRLDSKAYEKTTFTVQLQRLIPIHPTL